MTKSVIRNAYPVDNYVYELRFKYYSKFYQNVGDASDEQVQNPEPSKIIRHPLILTSWFYRRLENDSLEKNGKIMDDNDLVDVFSSDTEPKHAKLKENLLSAFHGLVIGTALVSIVIYIQLIFFGK